MLFKISKHQDRVRELITYMKRKENATQKELAHNVGIPQSTISTIMKTDRDIGVNTLDKLIDYTKVNPTWLFGYNEPMFLPNANKSDEPSERQENVEHIMTQVRQLLGDLSDKECQVIRDIIYYRSFQDTAGQEIMLTYLQIAHFLQRSK